MAAMFENRADVKLDKEANKPSETKHDLEFDSGSALGSVSSIDESEKLDESNSVPCQACRLLELKSLELKKQREDLKRSLLLHIRQDHDITKPRTGEDVKNGTVQEPHQGDVPNITKEQLHNLHSLGDSLPIFKKKYNILQPPEPMVKRLKGELAKSIGRKIDGCNLNILNPDSGDNLS